MTGPGVPVERDTVRWPRGYVSVEFAPDDDTADGPDGPDDEDGPGYVEGWSAAATNVLDDGGNLRILDERCTTCILGGERSITKTLRPGRVRDIVNRSRYAGHVPCHSTLSNTRPGAAVCHGWWAAVGDDNTMVRMMTRLNAVRMVPLSSLPSHHDGDRNSTEGGQVHVGDDHPR